MAIEMHVAEAPDKFKLKRLAGATVTRDDINTHSIAIPRFSQPDVQLQVIGVGGDRLTAY